MIRKVRNCKWRDTERASLLLLLAPFLILLTIYPVVWGQEAPIGEGEEEKIAAKPPQTAEGGNKSDLVKKGRELVRNFGCVVCHSIPEMDTGVREEAPELTFIGDKLRPDWLFDFLKNPYTIRTSIKGRMPNLRLTDEEALSIIKFLLSLKDEQAPPVPEKFRFTGLNQEFLVPGQTLTSADYFACFNCHQNGDKLPGGPPKDWAPDLSKARQRLDANWIYRWILNPQNFRPNTAMPAFLPDEESGPADILGGDEPSQIRALRDYVVSLGVEKVSEAYRLAREEYPNVSVAQGRSLVVKINCIGCHEIATLPQGKQVAPPLTHEGTRVRKDWLLKFLKEPWTIKPEYSIMGSEARMPHFRMTDEEVQAVVEFINAVLVDTDVPPVTVAGNTDEVLEVGERLFYEKYECKNCHRIGDKAGGIGPILTEAGERLNPDWVRKFIIDPRYFIPKTRMPDLRVSDVDAQVLAAYVTSSK